MASLTTLKDIETAINQLTPQEYDQFLEWMDNHTRPEPIDLQLKADLDAGRMNKLIDEAVNGHKSVRKLPLNAVGDSPYQRSLWAILSGATC